MVHDSKLFQPIRVGNITLQHRVAMAPLTRYRTTDEHVPLSAVTKYYGDRSSAPGTLIISEATAISAGEEAKRNLPGFTTAKEVEGWSKVYAAVHANGSYIFQQLWGLGRAADPEYVNSRGFKYGSSSTTQLTDKIIPPSAYTEEEIWEKIHEFADAAKRVIEAGGDGVEVHSAHGYLIDQFTRDSVNKRTDKWGGSVENRSRFLLEVVKAVVAAVGADRIALRLSPFATFQDSYSSDTFAQTLHVVREIKEHYKLAYISLVEAAGDPAKFFDGKQHHGGKDAVKSLDFILEEWDNHSPVIIAGGYLPDTAAWAVDERYKKWDVLIAFGRYFISNPDLVYRIKNSVKLTAYNRATFYSQDPIVGYNDYPFSDEYLKTAVAA